MEVSQYLIVKKTGSKYNARYTVRVTKSTPALASNEIAMKVDIVLPDAVFDKPAFSAKIVVPEDAVSQPVITAEVIDNVQEIIKQNTGFEVKLTLVEADEE